MRRRWDVQVLCFFAGFVVPNFTRKAMQKPFGVTPLGGLAIMSPKSIYVKNCPLCVDRMTRLNGSKISVFE